MRALVADTATGLFSEACEYLLGCGDTSERGGRAMLEAPGPVTLTLEHPAEHLVQQPARRINPWVSLAEFPWMVAGRNDISWLQHYLGRAPDFSDDGITWRGAYGPRLRRWEYAGDFYADQLAYIVNELRGPGMSRRAVASIWYPGTDYAGNSRDYPCTNWLSFQHRPGTMALDLTVGMRSNDLWWGWSAVNVVNWALLLEAVAEWSGGLAAGRYHHVADNLHVYVERHGERIGEAAREFEPSLSMERNTFRGELRRFTSGALLIMQDITHRRAGAEGALYTEPGEFEGGPDWLLDWQFFMGLHALRDKPHELGMALSGGFGQRREDWQRCAMQWALKEEWV